MQAKKSEWATDRAAELKLAARLYPVVVSEKAPSAQAVAHLQLEAMRYAHLAKRLKQRGQ
jgi:hypothetical protein